MTTEPVQSSDETVIELACRYHATDDAETDRFVTQLTTAWGERSGRGIAGAMVTESLQEVRLHTSCVATEDTTGATGEALRELGTILDELDPVPGVSLNGVTVEIIPGEQHAEHLDNLAAR
ncbi:hypothetical protein IL38_23750 [Actinopolyspora erythraea]|uniref:Uncharacterized protein n=1 Tax=Actinopolyspora erythraea TaxID=414996 RepID=A0ABR4WY70_9ACTN|nr:hypothetical protein [Actinopolyspora erythraea]KGI79327.1 hypothetical protein IL38_23750 [Actinopolyspora erythraea]